MYFNFISLQTMKGRQVINNKLNFYSYRSVTTFTVTMVLYNLFYKNLEP